MEEQPCFFVPTSVRLMSFFFPSLCAALTLPHCYSLFSLRHSLEILLRWRRVLEREQELGTHKTEEF